MTIVTGAELAAEHGLAHGAIQKRPELRWLLELLASVDEGNGVLEIGSDAGGTLVSFALITEAPVVGVTLHGARFSSGRPLNVPNTLTNVSVLEADSHTDEAELRVAAIHPGPFDLVFVDGDHSYRGVEMDFLRWFKWVRPGGLLAFHDVALHAPETGCEVFQFWRDLKSTIVDPDDVGELVTDPPDWGGIGVLRRR